VDECLVANGGCHAKAKCTNTAGSRTCSCLAGYTGNGQVCVVLKASVWLVSRFKLIALYSFILINRLSLPSALLALPVKVQTVLQTLTLMATQTLN